MPNGSSPFTWQADADFILSVCKAQFSEAGSNKEQVEQTIMIHLQDFLQELEQGKIIYYSITEI